MSVKIRLRRVGRKKQPYYRMVVAESTAPRDGVYLEEVGFYNPRTRPALLRVDLEKVDAWLGKGAEITESAASLVRKARKGGDSDVRFVQPGDAAPILKTATKPERRPTSQAVAAEPEAAPEGGAKDTVEDAAPEAEKPEPAETTAKDETRAAVEAEAPESSEAASEEQSAVEAEAPESSEAVSEEQSAVEAEAPESSEVVSEEQSAVEAEAAAPDVEAGSENAPAREEAEEK